MAVEEVAEVEYGAREHPLLHWLAPVVAGGAVWAARQAIDRGYERASGRKPPSPGDPSTSWQRAIGWTALTATTAAVIEVSVRRLANEREVVQVLQRRRPAAVIRSAEFSQRPDEPLGQLGARLLAARPADEQP